jgi:hypothetical protein
MRGRPETTGLLERVEPVHRYTLRDQVRDLEVIGDMTTIRGKGTHKG